MKKGGVFFQLMKLAQEIEVDFHGVIHERLSASTVEVPGCEVRPSLTGQTPHTVLRFEDKVEEVVPVIGVDLHGVDCREPANRLR